MAEARLTVEEASVAYVHAMRNPAAPGLGVCPICRTFHDPGYDLCYACGRAPVHLDALAPITYSLHAGQMHDALRGYKDDPSADVRRHHAVRLTAILWRFLEQHESCLARASNVASFDVVATVPSRTTVRDDARDALRTIVGRWCKPTAGRWQRVLHPHSVADSYERSHASRNFSAALYRADELVANRRVLLIDDTWTSGGAMQSAAHALRSAGAAAVGGVVLGRHLRADFEWDGGSSGDEYDRLSRAFDWGTCAVH